jgi:hypothetical protein
LNFRLIDRTIEKVISFGQHPRSSLSSLAEAFRIGSSAFRFIFSRKIPAGFGPAAKSESVFF